MENNLAVSDKKDFFSLAPRNLEEAMKYAKIISETDMVPKDFKGKPGNVLIAVQMGAEVGLPPTQALQNIAVINGRPALWGDAVLALVMASPECIDVAEEDDGSTATCTIKRRGKSDVARTFSVEDAKQAGLHGKSGPWTQYPKRMRQMRARSFCVRDSFPHLLKGISVAEEVRDYVVEKVVNAVDEGQPAATRTEQLKQKVCATQARQPDPTVIDNEADIAPEECDDSALLWQRITTDIDNAQTEVELKKAIADINKLDEDATGKARVCYRYRLGQLRGESVHIENGHVVNDETGEIII